MRTGCAAAPTASGAGASGRVAGGWWLVALTVFLAGVGERVAERRRRWHTDTEENFQMNKRNALVVALATISIAGAGAGTAFASSTTPSKPAPAVTATESPGAPETPGATDGDNVQQGDQSGPDTATAGDQADTPTSAGKAGAELAGSGESGVSDGPGGYADPVGGNADTQQQGEH